MEEKLRLLKDYFSKIPEVLMAFVFGSQVSKKTHFSSDWDISVYFKPKKYLELETKEEYPQEHKIWGDLINILETNDVDFVVLNRTRPSLVYNVLTTGIELKMADRKMYLDLLCKTSYEAMDWWQFVEEYWQICEKTRSLLPQEKEKIIKHLNFLENEYNEIEQIKLISWQDYLRDSFKRKIVERWIENLVMASLDIAKIILASDKREIPQSYREVLKVFVGLYLKVDETLSERYANFAEMRNIIAHEYLDIKWEKIKKFIEEAEKLYPEFIKKVKEILK